MYKLNKKTFIALGSGIVIEIISSLMKWLSNIIKDQIITTLTINSHDGYYYKFIDYLGHKNILFKSKHLSLMNGRYGHDDKTVFGFGAGRQIFKIDNQWTFINTERNINEGQRNDSITINIFGKNNSFFKVLFDNINKYHDSIKFNHIYTYSDYWSRGPVLEKRSIDSVFINEKIKNDLINGIDNFINSRQEYLDKGIFYHYGILLYGPPGTGKTSLIRALATKYNRNIYYISSVQLYKLSECLTTTDENSLIVIEDIDRNSTIKNETKDEDIIDKLSKANLSNLLNTLDGLLSVSGRITIITANDLTGIDSALFRPGRINMKVYLGYLDNISFENSIKFYYNIDYKLNKNCKIKDKTTCSMVQNDYNNGFSLKMIEKKYLIKV